MGPISTHKVGHPVNVGLTTFVPQRTRRVDAKRRSSATVEQANTGMPRALLGDVVDGNRPHEPVTVGVPCDPTWKSEGTATQLVIPEI